MPYTLVAKNGKFAVKTIAGPNKGHLHGWTTKPKAEAQMRLLGYLVKKGKLK
jgi:hypothetical protein